MPNQYHLRARDIAAKPRPVAIVAPAAALPPAPGANQLVSPPVPAGNVTPEQHAHNAALVAAHKATLAAQAAESAIAAESVAPAVSDVQATLA